MIHFEEKCKASFFELDQTTRQVLCGWIRTCLIPCDEVNWAFSSYALKHCFEAATDIYVSNDSFKYAMARCGFDAVDTDEENHHYHIKEDSIGLKMRCI